MSNLSRINSQPTSADVQSRLRNYLAKSAAANDVDTCRVVFLLDMSRSMEDVAGKKRRVDHLREALAAILPQTPTARLVPFDYDARIATGPDDLGSPSGGTFTCRAIELAASLRPAITILISDGEPNSKMLAFTAAEKLPGVLHTVFVGDDSNHAAIRFMRELARRKGGTAGARDLATVGALGLTQAIRGLLPA